MKKIIYLVAAFLCMACSDDHGSNQENGGASGSVTEVTPVTSDLSVDLSTDKAFYKPGEKVVFTAEDALPAGTKVRYRLLGEVVGEESVNGTSWTWQPPTTDFKGYMAELYRQENGTDVILGTIAVMYPVIRHVFPVMVLSLISVGRRRLKRRRKRWRI